MNLQARHLAAMAALLLSASAYAAPADKPAVVSAPAHSRPASPPEAKPAKTDDSKMDVPAPPMLLLFAMGTVGVIWGRRLAANAKVKTKRN